MHKNENTLNFYTLVQNTNLNNLYNSTRNDSKEDLNDMISPGFYKKVFNPTAPNSPGYYAYLLVLTYGNTGNVTQIAYGYNSNKISIRYRYSGIWSDWTDPVDLAFQSITIPNGSDIHEVLNTIGVSNTLYRQQNSAIVTNAPTSAKTYIDYYVIGSMVFASVYGGKIYVCSKWNDIFSSWVNIN